MPASNRLLRPAATLLSSTARQARPTACRGYQIAARKAHTSSRSAGGISSRTSRPALHSTTPASSPFFSGAPRGARSIFIQTEGTPNPDALKFLPNHRVLPEDVTTPFVEYLNPRSTIAPPHPSPLAAQLMNIDGVTSVFYGVDFITVTKSADANWAHIRPEIFSHITEAITSGQPIVTVSKKDAVDGQEVAEEADSLAYDENDSEVVGMIKELLETRIRPAIQEDGGDIEYRGFTDDGYVELKLRGACRTCDSSTVTLQNGIEGMLMHYIEEVKGVRQVSDPEEEIAMAEFEKFEEKLRAQKGPDAAPAAMGKGQIDAVA
ncbi:scaffold protein Nfu/NifU N terminal-domain-containing protein [Pestalotiopsis sp. NC0098]|nr:scaffold protein Nfu/NifU N terminal-domain-containing protein [Pestalotiopsis sp. NC0098]